MLSFFRDAVTTVGVVGEDRTGVLDGPATRVLADELAGFGGRDATPRVSIAEGPRVHRFLCLLIQLLVPGIGEKAVKQTHTG